tara:strand:- start:405 stop:536 length:132 start_codon:yes stop_codon:yes gene_type:complete
MWDMVDKRLVHAELTEDQALVLTLNDLEVEPDPKVTDSAQNSK